jgi:hypothetical protein
MGSNSSLSRLTVSPQPPPPDRSGRHQKSAIAPLELLASSPDGAIKELLVGAHGIDRDTIAGLVRAGLATARIETDNVGSKLVKVRRYPITNAGRLALEGWPAPLIHPVP